jgi:YEATS domain-containing protein 4
VLEKFPFEVSESGWGEFEINIKVFFMDPTEKPVDFYHILKLYPTPGTDPKLLDPKKPVVSEHYDEIIFNAPHEEFYNLMIENDPPPMPLKQVKYAEFCKDS